MHYIVKKISDIFCFMNEEKLHFPSDSRTEYRSRTHYAASIICATNILPTTLGYYQGVA